MSPYHTITSHCIPPEISTQILSHLPVKSLLRFRSVSKEWKSMIEDSDFARLHLSCYSNNRLETHIMVLEYPTSQEIKARWSSRCPLTQCYAETLEYGFSIPTPTFTPKKSFLEMVGDVDGLLLLMHYNRDTGSKCEVVLWNPSIRKRLSIPLPPSTSHTIDLCLGFDTSTNDYKVVNMSRLKEVVTIETFSLTSRSWKKGTSFTHPPPDERSRKVSFQGSVHWLEIDYDGGGYHRTLVSMNLISETLSLRRLSITTLSSSYRVEIPVVVAGNSIGLLVADKGVSDIWIQEHDGQWSKRFTMNTEEWELLSNLLHLNKDGVLIYESNDIEKIHICELFETDKTIRVCDLNTGKRSVVSESYNRWRSLYLGAYIENLVLLN